MGMLIAYDGAGNVVATLDYAVFIGDDGPVGFVDFDAQEQDALLDIWNVEGAVGSGVWPEYLGSRAHEFIVERDNGRIVALVHKASGHRRERDAVNDRGSQTRPLALDDDGRTLRRPTRPPLPIRR